MPSGKYNGWITLKKFGITYCISLVGVLIPFTIASVQNYQWPAEMAIYVPILVAIMVAFQNAYKHFNDE